MGKRMKLPFPFIKSTQLDPQWQWPSCVNSPNTLSFRSSSATTGDMFKTINSAYEEMCTTTTTSSTTESSSTQLGNPVDDDSVIQGVMQSERLFFTPGETNSILEEAKTKKKQNGFVGIKEIKNVVMEEMESANPYVDFRKSMEEMVETNEGLKGSMEGLQKLLSCYLRINERNNHGYIVGAFVDLLTNLSFDDDREEEDENNQNQNQYHNNNDLSSSSNSPISAMSFTSNSSSTCTSSTARNTTPCCSEGGSSSSNSSKKTLVVVENNASPCSSSPV